MALYVQFSSACRTHQFRNFVAIMKTVAVFLALVAVALARPQESAQQQIYLVNETPSNNIGLDSYQFGYEQSDGQKRDESAQVEARENPEESVLRVRGSYQFVAPDGQTYVVEYIADENGFQPTGAHLPVAPTA